MSSTPSRAFVYLLTRGKDGASPYPMSDILTKLSLKYENVIVNGLTFHPFHMDVIVDGIALSISRTHLRDGEADTGWFYVMHNGTGVRFNAISNVSQPDMFVTETGELVNVMNTIETDWHNTWPHSFWHNDKEKDVNSIVNEYASFVTQKTVTSGGFIDLYYLSETAFVDAVVTLVTTIRSR